MVRLPGFEPGSSTWQADVLNQARLQPLLGTSGTCGVDDCFRDLFSFPKEINLFRLCVRVGSLEHWRLPKCFLGMNRGIVYLDVTSCELVGFSVICGMRFVCPAKCSKIPHASWFQFQVFFSRCNSVVCMSSLCLKQLTV